MLITLISYSPGYGLQEIYSSAIEELKSRKKPAELSDADFELITKSSSIEDVLGQFQHAAQQSQENQTKQKIYRIGMSLVNRMDRFGTAIDMLAQSMPEIAGISLVGIIWGSFRFILIVGSS